MHQGSTGGAAAQLSREDWELRKRFVAFSVRDEEALVGLQAMAREVAPQVIDALYSWVTQFPQVAEFFADPASLQRARQAQTVYFDELVGGRYDEAYMQGRVRVGATHARLGIPTQLYLGMYTYYASLIIPHVVRAGEGDADRVARSLQAFIKLLLLDVELTLHTYTSHREQSIEDQAVQAAEKERTLVESRLQEAEEVSRAVAEANRVLASLAEGDLTTQMLGSYRGHLATLQDQLERSQQTLRSLVEEIREAADFVAMASGEIARASFELSGRTEAQAASLEQTAATAEELTATVRQNAASAQRAARLAQQNRNEARRGAETVQHTVEVMGAIKESSSKIADIIGTVDEIAFQTNILALNAAVEAARAGDQGRGFAVVAAEVRNLAGRCAQAAREIKQLIRASVERVDEGTQAVAASGRTLEELEGLAARVSELIHDMATSSHEQLAGVEHVGAAVVDMEHVTQQNAAMVEETVASAEQLDAQAGHLRALMAHFKLATTPGAGTKTSASQPLGRGVHQVF